MEQKEQEIEITEVELLDLDNAEDLETLTKETESQGTYFKPVNDVTYKIELTESKIEPIMKVFDGKDVQKYVMQVKATDSNKNEFVGTWEVGRGVLGSIVKVYEKGATFKMTKTGAGMDTRYSLVKDF